MPKTGGHDRWWVSPAIPTIANCVLAALWGFSALGGWGEAAFCGGRRPISDTCADGFGAAVAISIVPAALAAVIAVGAWALPRIRRDSGRLDGLLTLAAGVWIVAEGILFVGGYLAQP